MLVDVGGASCQTESCVRMRRENQHHWRDRKILNRCQ